MLEIGVSPTIGYGAISAVVIGVILYLWRVFRKAGKFEEEKIKNEILGKNNAELREAFTKGREREELYDEVESRVLNDSDDVDTRGMLNSYDYLSETKPTREVQ